MIQLTQQQIEAIAAGGSSPPTVLDPNTQIVYVLVRRDLYQRLQSEEYDDSPWTADERHALAWEAGRHAGWDEMDEYDALDDCWPLLTPTELTHSARCPMRCKVGSTIVSRRR